MVIVSRNEGDQLSDFHLGHVEFESFQDFGETVDRYFFISLFICNSKDDFGGDSEEFAAMGEGKKSEYSFSVGLIGLFIVIDFRSVGCMRDILHEV